MGAIERVVVFGNSGSGKSTLAKALCARHGIAHLDLDTLAWEPEGALERRPLSSSEADVRAFQRTHDEWVIEGCYSDLLALVIDDASELVFLNPGVEQCVANCRNRPWEPHKYATEAEQQRNLDMLLEWVKQYPLRTDEFSLEAHRALYESFRGRKVEHRSNIDLC